MEPASRLLERQEALLRDIESAARQRDVSAVLALLKKLEMLASLVRQQEEIDRRLAAMEGDLLASPVTAAGPAEVQTDGSERAITPKERGRRQRDSFVRALATKGITLQRVKGAILRSPRGIRVGVAYAREGQQDKWFLGLPEDQFQHAVLLCEERSGRMTHFSLPEEFVREHGESLSRKDGQVKFNVLRRGEEFFLHLPRRGSVSIDAFHDNFSGLI